MTALRRLGGSRAGRADPRTPQWAGLDVAVRRPSGLVLGRLRQGLQNLGLGRAPIVVAQVSLRSFGRVDGGARTVIAALRSLVPTVVVPTFTYETMLPAPPRAGVPNNAAREAASWDDFLHALGPRGGRPAWLDGRELQRRFGRIRRDRTPHPTVAAGRHGRIGALPRGARADRDSGGARPHPAESRGIAPIES